jgi:uncharacterized protein (TIGR02646 family)
MDKLLNPISYNAEQAKLVKELDARVQKDEKVWELDEVEGLRRDIRDFYRKEQKILCAYCKYPVSVIYPTNCHVEHIAPKSLHPEYTFEPRNLCVICSDCNQIKRDQETVNQIPDTIKNKYKTKYPDKSEDFFIVHPHLDKYDDHIFIVNGFYIDKGSKKGSFTIGACLLNRKFLIVGWEPNVVDDAELVKEFTEYIDEKDFHKRVKKLDKIKRDLFY